MTEKSLSDAVDKLAKTQAKQYGQKVQDVVQHALKDRWFVHGEYIGDYVRTVVAHWLNGKNPEGYAPIPEPPEKVIAAFRAAILKEILEKLPLVRQLDDMLDEQPQE